MLMHNGSHTISFEIYPRTTRILRMVIIVNEHAFTFILSLKKWVATRIDSVKLKLILCMHEYQQNAVIITWNESI